MLQLHSFINDGSDFSAKSDNSFSILEELLLSVLCYVQCHSYRDNITSSLIYTFNIFSIIFLRLGSKQSAKQ